MKCFKHPVEAISVCAYCGRGLCSECIPSLTAPRMVCSEACGTALANSDWAIQNILQKSLQGLRASAFYCYLCAGLSGGAAIVAWFMLPSPFLILFTGGCGLVLLAAGVWYTAIARKQRIDPARPPKG